MEVCRVCVACRRGECASKLNLILSGRTVPYRKLVAVRHTTVTLTLARLPGDALGLAEELVRFT
jgi:hypothetical protein